MAIAGLTLIVPSSVSNSGPGSSASVSASGKVTWATATGVSINGVFSSSYDNYLIVASGTSTNFTIVMNLRASGVDATGSNYTSQRTRGTGTTWDGNRFTSETFGRVTSWDTNPNGFHLYVYGPYLAQSTISQSISVLSSAGAEINECVNTHSLTTSYDGITLGTQGGGSTFGGSLTIYGLSQ